MTTSSLDIAKKIKGISRQFEDLIEALKDPGLVFHLDIPDDDLETVQRILGSVRMYISIVDRRLKDFYDVPDDLYPDFGKVRGILLFHIDYPHREKVWYLTRDGELEFWYFEFEGKNDANIKTVRHCKVDQKIDKDLDPHEGTPLQYLLREKTAPEVIKKLYGFFLESIATRTERDRELLKNITDRIELLGVRREGK